MAGIDDEILRRRERLVVAWCRHRGIPMAFSLAGGYAAGGTDDNRRRLVDFIDLPLRPPSVEDLVLLPPSRADPRPARR